MPSPLSVTAERLPAVVLRTTVVPPVVRLLLFASLSWTVMVEVVTPSAVIEVGLAVMVEVAGDGAPTVNVTVASSVMADPFRVPVIVALPGAADEVRVAV